MRGMRGMAGMAILLAAAASASSAEAVAEEAGVLPPMDMGDAKYEGTLCPKNAEHGRSFAKYCPVCKARLWKK
jgi:hypothetical protein